MLIYCGVFTLGYSVSNVHLPSQVLSLNIHDLKMCKEGHLVLWSVNIVSCHVLISRLFLLYIYKLLRKVLLFIRVRGENFEMNKAENLKLNTLLDSEVYQGH